MSRLDRRLLPLGLALALGCCATPDGTDYSIAAAHHENWARVAREGATTDEAAARSMAARGDQAGAEYSARSASEFSRKADAEQLQAAKDRWLSQWWPSFARPVAPSAPPP